MFRSTEIFKEVFIDERLKKKYAISNFGTFISYDNDMESGSILKCSMIKGFRIFRYKIFENGKVLKNKHVFIYKLVAENFVEKPSELHNHVIHLNFILDDDYFSNLKWVTLEEKSAHRMLLPSHKENLEKLVAFNKKRDGKKLTSTNVLHIKKILNNPNSKTSVIRLAKQFKVSTMQIYRIKWGENWKHLVEYIT